jgi:hypothetical protein
LVHELERRPVTDLPTSEATEHPAPCATLADVEPLDVLAVIVEGKTCPDVATFATTFDTPPMLRLGLLPELLAVTDKVNLVTLGTSSSRHAVVVTGVQMKLDRAALASSQPEVMNLVAIRGVSLEIFLEVIRLAPHPPIA